MTLLAPVWLIVGIAAALGVLALHFIARMRPAPMFLPTARFVPDLPARAASRAPRPTDWLLLLLRAAAALLLGLAFAGPIAQPARTPVARIVLLDRSAAVPAADSAGTLAASLLRDGDVLVTFDTTARAVEWAQGAAIPPVRQAPADLASALLTGMAEARTLAPRADSIEMVLVSPLDASAWNDAVLELRSEWMGAIRIERVPGVAMDSQVAVAVRGEPDDPLRASAALLNVLGAASSPVRIVRAAVTGADSVWVRDSGGVMVIWPRELASDSPQANTGAVIAGDVVAIAPWARSELPSQGRAVARWPDGTPAAREVAFGTGCLRHVGVGIPEAGDVALAPSTQRLVRALTDPCGAATILGPVADSLVERLAGSGGLVAGARVVRAGAATSPATPWLLAAALALLLIEWAVRERVVRS
jgi:hypothetical protein